MRGDKDRVSQETKPVFPASLELIHLSEKAGVPPDALGLNFREAASIVFMHAMLMAIRSPDDYLIVAQNCVAAADALCQALTEE